MKLKINLVHVMRVPGHCVLPPTTRCWVDRSTPCDSTRSDHTKDNYIVRPELGIGGDADFMALETH